MAGEGTASVEISNKGLDEIPEEVLLNCDGVRILDLSGNKAIRLDHSLKFFGNVIKLMLNRCALSWVPDEMSELAKLEHLELMGNDFSGGLNPVVGRMPRLKMLDLGSCKLRSLPESIEDLEQLEQLVLMGNDFSGGLNTAFDRMRRLKLLDLGSCKLRSVPYSIEDLEQLEQLVLMGNDFSGGLNSVLGLLRRLKMLNLGLCQLRSLPDSIGDLEQLEQLVLMGNDFSGGLNAVFDRMGRLKMLDLSSCRLSTLPDSIGDLEQLERLLLMGNDFSGGLNPVFDRMRRLKRLDLGSCKLRSVPYSIGDLEQLEELVLKGNNFSDGLNPVVGGLSKLKKLDLHCCCLPSVPVWLGHLEALQELDVGNNHLSSGLHTVAQLKQLRKLNVSGCHLHTLPDWLRHLQMLEVLDLSHNTFSDGLTVALVQLQRLKKLNLDNCMLNTIPEWFEHLYLLEELNLRDNILLDGMNPSIGRLPRLKIFNQCRFDITELPVRLGDQIQELNLSHYTFTDGLNPVLGRLKGLEKLYLIGCELTSLPDWLGDLPLLEELHLSKNRFPTCLSVALGKLRQLKRLHLDQCCLSELPDWIGNLEQLQELDLSQNMFSAGVIPAIGKLQRLSKLNLSNCGLSSLPTSFGDMEQLQELNLSQNIFSAGVTPALGRLLRLNKLDLSSCDLSTLPASFSDMEQLTDLSLKNNSFEAYPKCIVRLKNLRRLDISLDSLLPRKHNGIAKLPAELADSMLSELIIDGNPITEPPWKIWQQGLEAIRSYFKEEHYGTVEVCPDTINTIGDICAGKTSIARSLQKLSPQPSEAEKRTHVIDQLPVRFGRNGEWQITINDFGGHTIYHSVISIFLPIDGLVILACDMSKNFDEQCLVVRRWLLTVVAKCKEIRVIVVGTHADKAPGETHVFERKMNRYAEEVLKDAKNEVMHHKTILEGQLATDEVHAWGPFVKQKLKELEELLTSLGDAKVSTLALSCLVPNMGLQILHERVSFMLRPPNKMPRRWLAIMRDITEATSDIPYLTWKQLQEIYKSHVAEVQGDNDLVIILRYLASTSQIIWLEKHAALREVVFNSPGEIIKVCKQVLHHERAQRAQCNEHAYYDHAVKVPDSWAVQYPEDIERYATGFVHQPFLKVLLSSDSEQIDVTVNFLKNFNLISEIKPGLHERIFVIPSNLPVETPVKMLNLFEEQLIDCHEFLVMELSFVGSVIPKSFYETSVSSMLTAAYEILKQDISTEAWRDGLFILYKEVSFLARREDNKVTFAAFSERGSDMSLWSILRPVFERLHSYITSTWHGALPECHIVCPSCRRKTTHITKSSTVKLGRFKVPFEILACVSLTERAMLKCKECFANIPRLLCLQTTRNYQNAAVGKDLAKKLAEARPQLVRELDTTSIECIIDQLIAARDGLGLVTDEERQLIKAEQTSQGKSRRLLDAVSMRGEDAIRIFAATLSSSDCARPDLAELFNK